MNNAKAPSLDILSVIVRIRWLKERAMRRKLLIPMIILKDVDFLFDFVNER